MARARDGARHRTNGATGTGENVEPKRREAVGMFPLTLYSFTDSPTSHVVYRTNRVTETRENVGGEAAPRGGMFFPAHSFFLTRSPLQCLVVAAATMEMTTR